jgi:hypothetical protein
LGIEGVDIFGFCWRFECGFWLNFELFGKEFFVDFDFFVKNGDLKVCFVKIRRFKNFLVESYYFLIQKSQSYSTLTIFSLGKPYKAKN